MVAMTVPEDEGAWAGDDIPVPEPAMGELPVRNRATNSPTSRLSNVGDAPTFGALAATTTHAGGEMPTSWTRRKQVLAAAVAGCAVVATVLVLGGGDDSPATDASSSTTEVPDDTVERTNTTTATTTDTTTDTSEPARREPAASMTPSSVELPPEVAAISEPTEVVMTTDDGILHTLSLPSGMVRSVPIATSPTEGFFQGVVVAPDAAAIAGGSGIVIVPREGPSVVEIAADSFDGGANGFEVVDWGRAPDGTTTFRVVNYSNGGSNAFWTVGVDGEIAADVTPADVATLFGAVRSPGGPQYVNDAGGVYELAPDGSAKRIDDGVLQAASSSSLLLRQCTAELECGDVLVDLVTGERRPIGPDVIPDELNSFGYGLDLAPDGSAVTGIVPTSSNQDRVIVDLATGEQIVSPNTSWNRGSLWAADSSGVFLVASQGTGIEFVDRASGEIVQFADELGLIISIAVRHPPAELGPESTVTTTPITFEDGAEPRKAGHVVTALSRSGEIIEIDVDARTAAVWSSSELIAVDKPSAFRFADQVADQVAVVTGENPQDEPSGYVSSPGEQRSLPPGLFGPGPILAGPLPGTVWTPSIDSPPRGAVGVELVLVDLSTGALAAPAQRISVPGGVLFGGDGLGGLVVSLGGDVYVATAGDDATELQRLTSGELLAVGVDTAYVRECDDNSTCAVIRVDRVLGTRTPVAAVSEVSGLEYASGVDGADPPFGLMGSAVAPGGDLAVFRFAAANGGSEWFLFDVRGLRTPIGSLGGDAPFVWSVDASSAVTLTGSKLAIVDLSGVVVVERPGSLRALAGAPVPVATD
jgi:hypothetical protein